MELLILLGIGLTVGGIALALDDDDDDVTGEKITGTEEDNDLAGAEGNDTVFAGDGNDIVDGSGGDDRLFGQDGEDLLVGGEGNDFLRGGSDADLILDGTGNDTLIGDLGDDLIVATSALDPTATIEALRDWIANDDPDEAIQLDFDLSADTDDDADVIIGGFGDDDVYAGSGDTVSLGAGEDALVLGDWIEPGDEPVVLTDYNPAEDLLVYNYDGSGPAPEITVEDVPAESGGEDDVLLRANGSVFARIEGAGGLISPHNIWVLERA